MIIVTEDKITVTLQMMHAANMVKQDANQNLLFGVPVNPLNPSEGLKWIKVIKMEDEDFDKIEQYFFEQAKR
jgi:predicted phosphoribosyltransferase